MFESDFLEYFSHVHPVTPLVVFVPVLAYMVYLSVYDRHLEFGAIILSFIGGMLIWTFLEYMLHRFVFHYEPKTVWGKRIHFLMHGVHHDYPSDATRLVMPPGFSIPLAIIFYILTTFVFGARLTPPIFSGMVVGYLCYDMLHYATHHFSMKRGVFLALKQYHMRHHYGDEDTGYGVSSPIWDYVFGTAQKKAKREQEAMQK
ncbi:MAG: Sterol desaturase [Chlorobi bacterium]|nr:Sterol desaturase [Chlorobiota bacterium]